MRPPTLELVIFDLVGTTLVTDAVVSRVVEAAGAPVDADLERRLLMHYASRGATVPVRGVAAAFETLRERGAKLVIATPLPAVVADAVLDRLGWVADGLVDLRVAGDEVAPGAALLEEAMRRSMVEDVRRVASVADTPRALEAASDLGFGVNIGATWGRSDRSALVRAPHTALVDEPTELAGALFAPASRPSATRRINVGRGTGTLDR